MFRRPDNTTNDKKTEAENANKGENAMTENTNTETVDIDTQETTEETKKSLEIPATATRRPMAPMGGFGQPMGGFGQPAGTTSTPSVGHNSGINVSPDAKKLVLGEGISISGEINDCDYLVVEGSVKADFKGSERIEIAENGEFKGSAQTMDADIAGLFDGTLVVNGRLTVRANGKIKGTIHYQELAVEAGAIIEGKLNTITEGSKEAASSKKKTQKKKDEDENVAQMSLATGTN